jgi:hypothetical protein
MNRREYRQLQLAGAITFPATFPQLGRIALVTECLPGRHAEDEVDRRCFVRISESPSARVTITRRVEAHRVRAIFLPRDPNHVSYDDGTWLLDKEVLEGLKKLRPNALGILFVGENEPTLLDVTAGMTAAENAQYYPPLPCDRSHNHYACQPKDNRAARNSCSISDGEHESIRTALGGWTSCDCVDADTYSHAIMMGASPLAKRIQNNDLLSCDGCGDEHVDTPYPSDPSVGDA